MLIAILAIVGSLKLILQTNVVYPLMRKKVYAKLALAPALEIVAAVDVLLRLQLMGL
jgi:NADH:ubiquinone oxidoreductase subunit 6 (subunit J)